VSGAAASPTGVQVRIQGMANGGSGVGRLPDGRVAFVDGALPGETVELAQTGTGRYVRAALEVLPALPSAFRLPRAACPHFGAWPERGRRPEAHCGGCQWQHASYEAQLVFKADVVRDCLTRIGRLADPPVAPTIGMDHPWAYRNQLRVRLSGGRPALVAQDGRSLLPIDACPIAHPLVVELLSCLEMDLPDGTEVSLRAGIATGDQMIAIHAAAEDLAEVDVELDASVVLLDPLTGAVHVAAGRPFLVERLGGHSFMVPASGFFQVNTAMAEQLVAQVRGRLPARGERLIDLYSGVGTFAVLLADRFAEVVAVESHPPAVAAAVDNAAGLDHLQLVEAPAAEGLAWALGDEHGRSGDCIVLDPPRAGLDHDTLGLLALAAAGTMIYVSCDPATMARDARRLAEAGWELESSQPVDMFPQTFHVETVNHFTRAPRV
jgi:23S rRNA (uracil1939-C5)-methyltransferase